MSCNPTKCKEITFRKKGNNYHYEPILDIPQCEENVILGVTFQQDGKYSSHVKSKLIKANRCLYVLRSLRKEGYNQSEIDLLFKSIVLPNITYALLLYRASVSDLTPVQSFLDRCYKRKFISTPIDIFNLLEKQDRSVYKKISNTEFHPLVSIMPRVKYTKYYLRKKSSNKPKVNTNRFMNSYINRLIFKYNLAL